MYIYPRLCDRKASSSMAAHTHTTHTVCLLNGCEFAATLDAQLAKRLSLIPITEVFMFYRKVLSSPENAAHANKDNNIRMSKIMALFTADFSDICMTSLRIFERYGHEGQVKGLATRHVSRRDFFACHPICTCVEESKTRWFV